MGNFSISDLSSSEELRALIVDELRLQGLSTDAQNSAIQTVSNALLERASLAVLSRLPIETVEELSKLSSDEKADAIISEALKSKAKEMQEVIQETLRDGLKKYHEFLDTEMKTDARTTT